MTAPYSWLSVIKLATLWGLESTRKVAIAEIRKTRNPALKLAVAREHNVKQFLPGALNELVDRERSLEPEEYETLGIPLAANVVKLREECRRAVPIPRVAATLVTAKEIRYKAMEKIFGEEFVRDVKEGEAMGSPTPTHAKMG